MKKAVVTEVVSHNGHMKKYRNYSLFINVHQ